MRSLKADNPVLAGEWSKKNGSLKPDEVSYGSSRKVWWKGKCGHEWQATVKNRNIRGSGCPYCSGNKVMKGFNDLATTHPDIEEEWSSLNFPLVPSEVSAGSNRMVWWKCRECSYEWKARIADRTEGHGCPVCSGEKLIAGMNDLETLYPDIAEEWSGKNGNVKPADVWPKSRQNVWWHCRKCGKEWKGVIYSRVKGMECPYCKKERSGAGRIILTPELKKKAVLYYIKKNGIQYKENDESVIGIPLEIYLPEQKGAVEIMTSTYCNGKGRKWENAKNWLCLKSGIKLVRIIGRRRKEFDNCICLSCNDDSAAAFSVALSVAFDIFGIETDIDIVRDMEEIERYCK